MTRKKLKKALPRVEAEKIKKTKIRVIGIGGGGGSIVSEIALKIKKASFVVANTDLQALRTANRKTIRFQFGQNFTQGLGTGMNTELGREAAQNEKEKIKKLLEGQDFCVIVACLGGGTGSGAAPIFAQISKNLGNLTYGIFTLPFKFEGEKKMEIARNSLEKLKPNLNTFSLIPNERIFQIVDKKMPLKEALSAINKNLAESLGGLIEMIYQPGLINIDFADLKTILQGQGRLAYLNTTEVQGLNLGEEITKKVISNPLYPYGISGAKGVLFNIAGEKNLTISEVSQISKNIGELINKEAKVIFGIDQKKSLKDKIKITLLATGCGTRIFGEKAQKRRLKKKPKKQLLPEETPPIQKQPQLSKLKPPKPRPSKTKREQGREKIKVVKRRKAKPKKVKPRPFSEKGGAKNETPQSEPEVKTGSPLTPTSGKVEIHILRKNALQIKKEAEEAEKELLEQEKIWEPPAFLRRRPSRQS